jgi:hypothetical protein
MPMMTSAEYLALSERYRLAKLNTRDPVARDQLETFERSYLVLARSLHVLARSNAVKEAFEKHDKHGTKED